MCIRDSIIATSACRLCIDYIQQQCVCVFVPFILATSPSDQGETCHFVVYLEDYTLVQCFFCSTSRTNRGHTGGGNTAVHKKIGVLVGEVKNGVK